MLLMPTSCGPGPPQLQRKPSTSQPPSSLELDQVKLSKLNNRNNENHLQATKSTTTTAAAAADVENLSVLAPSSAELATTTTTTTTIATKVTRNENQKGTAIVANYSSRSTIGSSKFSLRISKSTAHIHHRTINVGNVIATANSYICNNSNINTGIVHKWLLMFLMMTVILTQASHQVAAEKSKHYYMQSLCKNHFLQQLYRKIDGAVLWSQNERNLDCIITFQTHSILQRFMLRFDMLQLDCNDHLLIYDGAHAVTTPKIDISCRNTKNTVNSILTRTNFVTLKYVTDGWGTDANGFKLVITSVKDPKHTCKDFTCATREFCIHPDLLCDGVNHCGDNSDESVQNLCQSETTSTVFGVDMTWFVLIVVSVLLILSALIVGIAICVCRRQDDSSAANHNTALQLHHTAETNGSSKHLHYHNVGGGVFGGGGGTLTREHTQLPPTSGNWHHPAGPSGYHRILHNYLKMATKVRPIWCLANSVN